MKISIVVCAHKVSFIPKSNILRPIFVGKSNNEIELPNNYIGDNAGDNISNLNYSYCELTGLYWAWKNIDSDYIGLCHYRRFFSFRFKNNLSCCIKRISHYLGHIFYSIANKASVGMYFPYQYSITDKKTLQNSVELFEKDLCNWLTQNPNCELLALKPVNNGKISNHNKFSIISGEHHIQILRDIIKDFYIDILPSFDKTLSSNKLHYANMIIMKKELFSAYCNFIFSVLRKYNEVLINKGYYNDLTEKSISRISGYMGELLTDAFIIYAKNSKKNIKLLYQIQYEPK